MKRTYLDLTREQVLAEVRYEPSSGSFYWVRDVASKGAGKGGKPHAAGAVASRKAAKGYLGITILGVPILCHRLAWFIVKGVWPPEDVDHKDGNRANNRFSNLREGSRAFNMQNLRRSHVDSASQLLGAYYNKSRGTWFSAICKDGKSRFLGSFPDAEAAASAYVQAKRSLHEACTI